MNNIDNEIICECGGKCRFLDNNRGYQISCGNQKCNYVNNKRKESSSKTFNNKYGGHPMKTNEVKNKLNKSMNTKYGFENITTYRVSNGTFKSPFSEQKTKEKIKQTFIKKYGGHPMQTEDVFLNNLKSRVSFKEYALPSGKIVKIQGYENFALDYLLSIYDESDIIYTTKEINKTTGIIYYTDSYGNNKRYYPDFFVKSCNKVFEVKSIWTYKCKIDQNKRKMEKCILMGLDFEFLIFHQGKLIKN
jgi:hypothetical protein